MNARGAEHADRWTRESAGHYQWEVQQALANCEVLSLAYDASRIGCPAEDTLVVACCSPLHRLAGWLMPQILARSKIVIASVLCGQPVLCVKRAPDTSGWFMNINSLIGLLPASKCCNRSCIRVCVDVSDPSGSADRPLSSCLGYQCLQSSDVRQEDNEAAEVQGDVARAANSIPLQADGGHPLQVEVQGAQPCHRRAPGDAQHLHRALAHAWL
eukprot:4276298-Amphidinium_carterae.4